MNLNQTQRFIRLAYDQQMSQPIGHKLCPMLIGPPGIGKTSFIEQFAAERGIKVFTIILAQANPSEVAGIVMPTDGKVVEIYDPKWVDNLDDGDILFFDEVLKAPVPTLNSCLTMIQERRLTSGSHLPNVAIFAASNWDRAFLGLPLEVRQRFHKVDVEFDQSQWCEYMMQEYNFYITAQLAAKVEHDLKDDHRNWNQLTPRECTKMLLWMRETTDRNDRALLKHHLRDIYGAEAYLWMEESAGWNKKRTVSERIVEAVVNWCDSIDWCDPATDGTVFSYNTTPDGTVIVLSSKGPGTLPKPVIDSKMPTKELLQAMSESGLLDACKDYLANVNMNEEEEPY